jgi:hypothetical protein
LGFWKNGTVGGVVSVGLVVSGQLADLAGLQVIQRIGIGQRAPRQLGEHGERLAARDVGIVGRVENAARRLRQKAVLLGAQEIRQEAVLS